MDSSRITRLSVGPTTPAMAFTKAEPSQGQLLSELLESLNKAKPATGSRKATPQEIGEALKLKGEDLQRFIPLVDEAEIASDGAMKLRLRAEFQFKPHPEADDLLIKRSLQATVSPGKLEVAEGLQAVLALMNTNIKVIENATEEQCARCACGGAAGVEVLPHLSGS